MLSEQNVLRIQGIAALLPNPSAPQSEWISALPLLEELIGEIQASQQSQELQLRMAELGTVDAGIALRMLKRRHRYFSAIQQQSGVGYV